MTRLPARGLQPERFREPASRIAAAAAMASAGCVASAAGGLGGGDVFAEERAGRMKHRKSNKWDPRWLTRCLFPGAASTGKTQEVDDETGPTLPEVGGKPMQLLAAVAAAKADPPSAPIVGLQSPPAAADGAVAPSPAGASLPPWVAAELKASASPAVKRAAATASELDPFEFPALPSQPDHDDAPPPPPDLASLAAAGGVPVGVRPLSTASQARRQEHSRPSPPPPRPTTQQTLRQNAGASVDTTSDDDACARLLEQILQDQEQPPQPPAHRPMSRPQPHDPPPPQEPHQWQPKPQLQQPQPPRPQQQQPPPQQRQPQAQPQMPPPLPQMPSQLPQMQQMPQQQPRPQQLQARQQQRGCALNRGPLPQPQPVAQQVPPQRSQSKQSQAQKDEVRSPSRPPLPTWSPKLLSELGPEWQAREPIPLELLEEEENASPAGFGDAVADGGDLLPPLPVMDPRWVPQERQRSRPSTPPSSDAAPLPPEGEAPPAPVLRATRSYRRRAAESSLAKGRSGAALSSRPTTAGDEESMGSAALPHSRQSMRSVRSVGWREEWTPGVASSAVPAPPPLLTAERVAVGAAVSLARLGSGTSSSSAHARPPRPPADTAPLARDAMAEPDDAPSPKNFEAALQRMSEKGNAMLAMPPDLAAGKRRWASCRSASSGALGSESPTPRASPERTQGDAETAAGPSSSEGSMAPPAGNFSDLALSFAALNHDFA